MTCSRCNLTCSSLIYDLKSDSEKKNGICSDCYSRKYKEKYEGKNLIPLENLKKSEDLEGYLLWPHNYIPDNCPYCSGDTYRHFIGVDEKYDHIYHQYYCPKCKIDFGYTD